MMDLPRSPLAPAHFPILPLVKGVRSAALSRGFYAGRGKPRDDVFLFAFDEGTHCGGVFTRSMTASADVLWCREALAESGGLARGLVVNSGNSNAFTGPKGVEKNEATLAAMCAALEAPKHSCYLGATGVIGEPLADPNYIGAYLPQLTEALSTPKWEAAARAFMTTDTFPKGAGTTLDLFGHSVNIAGIAKGSGMIAPNMSTMLAYVMTDAAIAPGLLQQLTAQIAEETFQLRDGGR